MKILSRAKAAAIMLAFACLSYSSSAQSPSPATPSSQKDASMTHATGTFEVKLTPQDDKSDDKSLGRFTIEKQWHGDLEGTSKAQMLTGGNAATGSAGYVAMEKVTGTLKGVKGTFILQHSGTMTRGEGKLTITVVPDSGTGELQGLTGTMTIKIENGKHFYDFGYKINCPCE